MSFVNLQGHNTGSWASMWKNLAASKTSLKVWPLDQLKYNLLMVMPAYWVRQLQLWLMQPHVGRAFALCLHKMAVHGGSIPYSEAVSSCEDHGSTALQFQVLDSDGDLSPVAAMTRQGMSHGLLCCLCMRGSGTAVTSLLLGQSQQARWESFTGSWIGPSLTHIKGRNQRSGSLTTYICSWSANAADSCEMPVCPTGDLKDMGLGCFAPSWWHLSISAVFFIAVKIQAVQPNVGCVLEYSQERRSIPRGFVFPLQSSLVTDVAWPRGSWRWSLNLPSQWAEKGAANYRSLQPKSLYFIAFLTLFSNRILSVCVLPTCLQLLRGQGTTCTWSQPSAG